MKKPLLDVIFASEKRKQALLILQDGAKEMEVILKALDTTRQALLPQMKILEEHHLVSHDKDLYELTTIGKLLVKDMAPLVNITGVLDIDIDYWGTHNLEFIPPSFMERINELNRYRVLSPTITEMFDINKDFIESALNSTDIYLVTTIMHPGFPPLLSEFIEGNRKVTMIITNELYNKFTSEFYDSFKTFIEQGVKFYLYQGDLKVTTLSITESCFILRLLSENNDFSHKQLLCNDLEPYHWIKDLFDHYLRDSTLISEI